MRTMSPRSSRRRGETRSIASEGASAGACRFGALLVTSVNSSLDPALLDHGSLPRCGDVLDLPIRLAVSVLLCSGIRIARATSKASGNPAVSNQRVTTFDRSRESFGGCHFVRGRLGVRWRRRTRWQMSRRRQWVDRQQRMTVVVYRTTANAASTHGLVTPGIRLLAPSKIGQGDSRMF